MKTTFLILIVFAVIALAFTSYKARQFAADSRAFTAGTLVDQARTPLLLPPDDPSLPVPLRRYLGLVLPRSLPSRKAVFLTQSGNFQIKPDQNAMQLSALQTFVLSPPGLMWHAKINMLPGIAVLVRDSYWNGRGRMFVQLGGVYTLANARGPELTAAALQRFAAEMAWFPEAFLIHEHVGFAQLDGNAVRMSVRDGELEVYVDLHFGSDNLLVRVDAERFRELDGNFVLTPWSGYFGDYRSVDGMLIPHSARAVWHLAAGEFEYVRLHLEGLTSDGMLAKT